MPTLRKMKNFKQPKLASRIRKRRIKEAKIVEGRT